ncbi:MAG: ABC transporter substrate-binding protein [Micromonosporaceae bacterium]
MKNRTRTAYAALVAVLAMATAACGPASSPDVDPGPTRTVKHAAGVAKIKGTPKRVVVLDTGELDTAVALGVKPVGMTRADVNTEVMSYLKDDVAGVEVVGTIQDPNLEKIAGLKPDLILGSKIRVADKYDKLNEIAPTVLSETVGVSWKENFLLGAEALNKKADAEEQLAAYQKKAKDLGEKLGDPAKTEVSMVRFMPGGKGVRLYTPGSFIGTILADVGVSRPESQRDESETFVEVGPEEISKADGDIIFYSSYGPKNGTKQGQITDGALWQKLGAVSDKRAIEVSDDLWYLGIGVGAADKILDELGTHLDAK